MARAHVVNTSWTHQLTHIPVVALTAATCVVALTVPKTTTDIVLTVTGAATGWTVELKAAAFDGIHIVKVGWAVQSYDG
jgi:hypothetical protein